MKTRERIKRKRNISVFTVVIWILIILVMSVITISNMKEKNALEEEQKVRVEFDVSDLDEKGYRVEEYDNFLIEAWCYEGGLSGLFEKYEDGKVYYVFDTSKNIDFIEIFMPNHIEARINGERISGISNVNLINKVELVDNGNSKLVEINYDISELDESYTKEEIEWICSNLWEGGYIEEIGNGVVKAFCRGEKGERIYSDIYGWKSIELYNENGELIEDFLSINDDDSKQVYNLKIKDIGTIKKYFEFDISALEGKYLAEEVSNKLDGGLYRQSFIKESSDDHKLIYSARFPSEFVDKTKQLSFYLKGYSDNEIFLKEALEFQKSYDENGTCYYIKKDIFEQDVYRYTFMCEQDIVYNVEQIMSIDEVSNDSTEDYIIVAETDGKYYALASSVKEDSTKFVMDKDNAEEIKISEDGTKIITTNMKENVLWNFTMSKKSVEDGENGLVIASSKTLFDGSDETRTQIFFDTTNTANNPAGMSYSNDTYDYTFHFNSDGTLKIEQNNGKAKYSYLRFYTPDLRFLSGTPGKAAKVKIYKVKREITEYKGNDYSNFESEPEYPNPGSVMIDKNAIVEENYENTGIAKVELTADAVPIEREKEVVLIMDYSNSIVDRTGEDLTEKKIEISKRIAIEFAEKLIAQNPSNKIAVVKFTGEIIDKEVTENLGLTNDLEKIKEIINLPRTDNIGGTNYTIAFEEALKILDNKDDSKDKIVIFMSDGAPTIYNRLKFSVFNKTDDGIVGNYATNWVNYFLNNKLYTNEDLKKAGVKIYTVGLILEEELPIASNGSFIVKSEDLRNLLENLSTDGTYYCNGQEEEGLVNIYNKIYDKMIETLDYVPKKVKIIDEISEECSIVTNENEVGKITLEKNGKVIEEITFDENGEYSNLIENENIVKEVNGEKVILGKYVKVNDKNIEVDVGILNEKVKLTYYVYLEGSTNLKNEGKYRASGTYDTNKIAELKYENHVKEEITKKYPNPKITWKKEVKVNYIPEEGGTLEGKLEEILKAGEYVEKKIEIKEKEGYKFIKWEVEKDGKRIEIEPTEYQINEDTIFYAVFEKIPVEESADTSDINIGKYVVISLIAIIGITCGIFIIRNNKKDKTKK